MPMCNLANPESHYGSPLQVCNRKDAMFMFDDRLLTLLQQTVPKAGGPEQFGLK